MHVRKTTKINNQTNAQKVTAPPMDGSSFVLEMDVDYWVVSNLLEMEKSTKVDLKANAVRP